MLTYYESCIFKTHNIRVTIETKKPRESSKEPSEKTHIYNTMYCRQKVNDL